VFSSFVLSLFFLRLLYSFKSSLYIYIKQNPKKAIAKPRWFYIKLGGLGKIHAHPFLTSLEKRVLVHFVIMWVQFDQEKATIKLVN